VSVPRRLLNENRLICWLQVYVNNPRHEPVVGQAVVSWVPERSHSAALDVLDVLPDVEGYVAHALAYTAVREAAEAGVLHVITRLENAVLHELGFRHVAGAECLSLATTDG
jgi:hypothetical protein